MENTSRESSSLVLLQSQQVEVHRYAISCELRYALSYGCIGGLITALLGEIAAYLFFYNVFPDEIYPLFAYIPLLEGLAVLLLIGLAVTLIALRKNWKAPTRKARFLTGAGVGLFFALTTHTFLMGGVDAIISNRSLFTFFPNKSLSIYLVIAGHQQMIVVMMGLFTLLGAGLGGLLLPQDVSAKRQVLHDAAGSFAAILLPVALYIMAVLQIPIFTWVQQTLPSKLTESAQSSHTDVVLLAAVPPILTQLIVQGLVLIWTGCGQAGHLHRGMLRFAQVLYGIGASVGQVVLQWFFNPAFLLNLEGQITVGLSVILALAFAVIAEMKLRSPQPDEPIIRLALSTRQLVEAGAAVLLILWLLMDAFVLRLNFNLFSVTSLLVMPIPINSTLTLDEVINIALFQGIWNALTYLILMFVVGYLPLGFMAWLATKWEQRWFSSLYMQEKAKYSSS